MNIINLSLDELTPYENNPRNNDNAVEKVAESIKEFGFRVPIIIDKDNVIVAGHTRYKASKLLGLDTVPCIIADDLTDDQIRAFRIADNKVAEFSTWDDVLLDFELEAIEFNMEPFGFEIEPIEQPIIERDDVNITDTFEVVVSCADENELEQVYEKLTGEGYSCRISTL